MNIALADFQQPIVLDVNYVEAYTILREEMFIKIWIKLLRLQNIINRNRSQHQEKRNIQILCDNYKIVVCQIQ